ncbi:hypothetical protein [Pyxidicoccus sp. MSG2]|uniref:hypothetical protein n=1 Tax=Pyxidicoccus sp. MSG2 TaxID=2996790 RepID=UPI0022707CA4|nr:hypothetical protein [Pyxidicoccus sp. MSG2]MCY1023895.1 hypothetical protein [Pyxidicoccus sp. MSG2]
MRVLFSMSPLALCALLAGTGCATTEPSKAQQVLLQRPPAVHVTERTASLSARPAGCAVEYVKQDLEGAPRTRKVGRLVLTGVGLDRAQAEKLLNDKVCGLGGEKVFIESEEYGRPGERDEVEALAYAFESPVNISHSGLVADLAAKPPDCRLAVLRTKQPDIRYQEIAGLHFKLSPEYDPGGSPHQVRAMVELRAAACHLGADAILITQETYDLPGMGSVVSGTAIVFEENLRREAPPRPGEQTL